MTAPIFVDTNVLIYALAEADPKKLQADQDLGGVLVVNPFLCDPAGLPRA
jgi:predicted nucleic acid-binding protein